MYQKILYAVLQQIFRKPQLNTTFRKFSYLELHLKGLECKKLKLSGVDAVEKSTVSVRELTNLVFKQLIFKQFFQLY